MWYAANPIHTIFMADSVQCFPGRCGAVLELCYMEGPESGADELQGCVIVKIWAGQ